jgi:hypothetical protein
VIPSLIHGYQGARDAIIQVRDFFSSAFVHPAFKKVAVEFFTEAAVLAFIFPALDTIVEFGPKKVTASLAFGSIMVAVFFLFIAGMLSRTDKE